MSKRQHNAASFQAAGRGAKLSELNSSSRGQRVTKSAGRWSGGEVSPGVTTRTQERRKWHAAQSADTCTMPATRADTSPARVDNPLCRVRNQTPEERVQRRGSGSIPHQGSMAHPPDDSGPESSGNLFRPGQFTGLARIELLPPKFVWIAAWPFGESGSCRAGMYSPTRTHFPTRDLALRYMDVEQRQPPHFT